jgi:hypothetical protein
LEDTYYFSNPQIYSLSLPLSNSTDFPSITSIFVAIHQMNSKSFVTDNMSNSDGKRIGSFKRNQSIINKKIIPCLHFVLAVCILCVSSCCTGLLLATTKRHMNVRPLSLMLHRQSPSRSVLFGKSYTEGSMSNDCEDERWQDIQDEKQDTFARRSYMPQFIRSFLAKDRESDDSKSPPRTWTHMIGIPMSDCHQLQIELESVQRAILYHCPPLIHACIVPSLSRMPLLYIDASNEPSASVTLQLRKILAEIVKKHCFGTTNSEEMLGNEEANKDLYSNPYAEINTKGYQPLTMTFEKLEIDGEANEVLYAVSKPDAEGGLTKLQAIMSDLQTAIVRRGWFYQWPSSDVQGIQEGAAAVLAMASDPNQKNASLFRPRIPFMRLPPNFKSYLRPLDDDDDFHSSEEGGNGISPIFWIKWENDVMGSHVRLREVGIYARRPGSSLFYGGQDESTFYVPHETVGLPDANEFLYEQEKIHQDYNEQRRQESELRMAKEVEDDTFLLDPNLDSNRERLESIMRISNVERDLEDNESEDLGILQFDKADGRIPDISNMMNTSSRPKEPNSFNIISSNIDLSAPEDSIDTDNLRKIIENRPSQQKRTSNFKAKNQDVPPIESNPIFQAYRDGTLASKVKVTEQSVSADSNLNTEESIRGFWKIVRSPLGDDTALLQRRMGDTQSDNFVLRVDGTVSGGPVLDYGTFNKASGGTWRILKKGDESCLRIRLVIPPQKKRIMVWEGEINLESTLVVNSPSILDAVSFAKIIEDDGSEGIITCSGKVRHHRLLSIGQKKSHKVKGLDRRCCNEGKSRRSRLLHPASS